MRDNTTQADEDGNYLSPQAAHYWPVFLVIASWIAIVLISVYRYQPPDAVTADAAPQRFSAGRAELIFEELFSNDVPHPAESAENAKIREKIVRLFEVYGFKPKLHHCSAQSQNPLLPTERPLQLWNIVAVLEGKTDKSAVMLAAHFDSHPNAPGASDDGVGTAVVLEIARMLSAAGPQDRDIVFLLTDGEEYGTIGAGRFVAEHPLAKQIVAAVNLEARGSTGPSLMFETGSDSWWLIRMFARVGTKPFTSSLFYEIYRHLPNDTDFTIFKQQAGMQGFNFAFIGDVKHYHTPEDNFENADRSSMQHHGDNALSLIRALANTEIEQQPPGRAVYFDVFGWFIVYWPAEYSLWMAIAATGLCLMTAITWGSRRSETGRSVSWIAGILLGVLFACSLIVGMGLVGGFVDMGLALDDVLTNPFPTSPVPVALAYWTLVFAALLGVSFIVGSKIQPLSMWSGIWLFWCILSLASAIWLNGGSYLFVVPALSAGLAGMIGLVISRQRPGILIPVVPALVAGLIWLPLERMFYDAVGFSMNIIMIVRVTLVLSSIAPVVFWSSAVVRLWLLITSSLVAIVCTLMAVLDKI